MKQRKYYPKVAFDTFYEQFKWSIWFLGILAATHIAVLIYNANTESAVVEAANVGFFEFSRYSTAIFMLVCGIMAVYVFMASHVQQGVTRKDVYIGIAGGTFVLSLFLTGIPLVLNGIEFLLTEYTALPLTFTSLGSGSEWLMEAVFYLLNIFTYYLVGWLIGIGYYRFGWLIGFLFIAMAIVALSLNGYFWGDDEIRTVIPWIPSIQGDAAPAVAIIGSLILIAVMLAAMRMLTKRMTIKL